MNIKILSSLVWKMSEKLGSQLTSFVVSIILARILMPKEYGLIALIMIFITLSNVIIQSGFSTALIQKKTVDDVDLSTTYFTSIVISILLFIMLFFSAPLIASIFDSISLVALLRISSLSIVIGALSSVHFVILIREFQFKKIFLISLFAQIISSVAGVLLALNNYGVWALVVQHLSFQIFYTIFAWLIVKWIPTFVYSLEKLGSIFKFGLNIMVAAIIDTLFLNMRTIIIGKFYSADMLGNYNRGRQFPSIVVESINGTVQSVMLPVFSNYQDDYAALKALMRKSVKTGSFLVFPLMAGLISISEPLVTLLLTDKWSACIPYLKISCLAYALLPIESTNLQAIKGLGLSKVYLKLELAKKLFGIIVLLLTFQNGISAIAWGGLFVGIFSTLINVLPNSKILGYKVIEQFNDVFVNGMQSLFMWFVLSLIELRNIDLLWLIVIKIFIGTLVYVLLSIITKNESFAVIFRYVSIRKSQFNG